MKKLSVLRVAAISTLVTALIGGPAYAAETPANPGSTATVPTNAQVEQPDPEEKLTAWINGVQYVPGAETSSQRDVTPMATWAACGVFDGEEKLVRQFWRSGWAGVVTTGYGYLRCGPNSATWGYRHIREEHQQDWTNVAAKVGADWRSFSDWAIENVLANPDSVVYRDANATFTYRTIITIHNSQGQVTSTYRPLVSIALGTERIITAYPISI